MQLLKPIVQLISVYLNIISAPSMIKDNIIRKNLYNLINLFIMFIKCQTNTRRGYNQNIRYQPIGLPRVSIEKDYFF